MRKKVKCWESFQCNERNCPAYESKELRCWLIKGTHCRGEIQGMFLEKIEMCLRCEVLKANIDIASVQETLRLVSEQFTGVSADFSEVFEALEEISSGNPDVKISETSRLELVRKLKHMVNMTAENLAEIVDLSHEFAIGLAEHFDVLHRVSKGELTARVSGTSQVELLESLAKVTNQTIESVSKEIVEHRRTEKHLRKRTHDLAERVKELNCLYGISNLVVKPGISLEAIIQGTIDLVPPSWQYPEITCARVILEGQEFRTKNFQETIWKQASDIIAHGDPIGTLQIFYLEQKRESDEGPFAQEERLLLDNIAKRLATIIEHKRSQEKLRQSENKYRILLEHLPQKIFLKDRDSAYVSCNENFARDLKIKPHEIKGKTDYEFFPKELAEKYRADDNRIVMSGKTENIEEKYLQDGKEVWVHTVKTPVRDKDSTVTGILGIFWDITKQKQAEQEKKALQSQILQSEKMASIGQLAAGVAHEINNPTGFVSSNLNTLKDYQNDIHKLLRLYKKLIADLKDTIAKENLASSIAQQVEHIAAFEAEIDVDFILDDIPGMIGESREGTERIKKIVLGLKDFAHPGEDKPAFADINKGLDSTLNVVWNELKYKATVTKEYGELPEVRCYPQQLNQVFVNLLVNAAQAIEKKGEIKITTRALDGKVEIAISDTGRGIPKENLSKVFDPFFTTKEVGKGTGLGLNVAYNIIDKHNGIIEVESELGKGTTFTIRIPVERDT